jgi:hypothetical protein
MANQAQKDAAKEQFADGVSLHASNKKIAVIGQAASLFMLNRGDIDPSDFAQKVKRRIMTIPAPNVLTLAATTAFADGTWTHTCPADRKRIIWSFGIEVTNLLAAAGTRTPDGVINQLRLAGQLVITKSNGKVETWAFAAADLGSTDGMPDGLTTAVYHAVSQRNLVERLQFMVKDGCPLDTLEPLESITIKFTGLNGTTCADSASGVAGNLLLLCEDLPNN